MENNKANPVDRLLYIEHKADVENWRLKDLPLWPVLRIKLGFFFSKSQNGKSSGLSSVPAGKVKLILGVFKHFLLSSYSLAGYIFSRRKKGEVLFFCNQYDYILPAKGVIINKHVDPTIRALKLADNKLVIEQLFFSPYPPDSKFKGNSRVPCIDAVVLFAKIASKVLAKLRLGAYLKHLKAPIQSEEINIILKEFQVPERLYKEASLVADYLYISILSAFWRKVLTRISPQSIITTEYYSNESFALQVAAHQCHIKIADWQHGIQGENHIAYAPWSKLTREQLCLFPDYFLVWGTKEKEAVLSWNKYGTPLPVVIGNGWLEMTSSLNNFNLQKEGPDFMTREGRKTVLFTLQNYLPPDWFFEEMVSAGNGFFWIFKLHPVWQGLEREIREKLSSYNVDEYSFTFDLQDVPLPYLLKEADIHITGWSTCALERLYFGKKSLIIHEKGLDYFAEEISKGFFITVLNAVTFAEKLKSEFISMGGQDTFEGLSYGQFNTEIINFLV